MFQFNLTFPEVVAVKNLKHLFPQQGKEHLGTVHIVALVD
jgi:hypothetical protein